MNKSGNPSKSQRMYDTLKSIARGYQSTDQIRKSADKEWGMSYEEALEMAYENMMSSAEVCIRGMRRPK